jgi:hypothetical protein
VCIDGMLVLETLEVWNLWANFHHGLVVLLVKLPKPKRINPLSRATSADSWIKEALS